MVIEKNIEATYRTITRGYTFMNIEDRGDRRLIVEVLIPVVNKNVCFISGLKLVADDTF